LVAALAHAGGTRVLAIELDSSKASGTEVNWAEDLREVIETVASKANLQSNNSFRKFTSRANQLATGYLVAKPRLPESISEFISSGTDDISDDVREKVEKDLRDAIENDFPVVLPERPGLSPDEIEGRIRRAEQRSAELRRLQIEVLQDLLNDLAGTSKGTYEGNKADAIRVMKLVDDAKAVLLYTGPGKKGTQYVGHPCTIRCEFDVTDSFQLRTAAKASTYVTSVEVWPPLKAVPREELPASILTQTKSR
jgi:hypothetical protein